MTLDLEKFKSCANHFASISSLLQDDWNIRTHKKNGIEDLYLEKRVISQNNQKLKELELKDDFDSVDFVVFVYHIIYSRSYSVPILCFNANYRNGKLASLQELWDLIPDCYKNDDPDRKWSMLTQQEHPILGIPCFVIHPCHTAEMMQNCTFSNYIISWLSTVGPVVGLNLSLEYAKYA